MGISPSLSIHCTDCKTNSQMKPNLSKFAGYSYNGQSTKRENCSWHSLNIQLVLGTLATGLGPADLPPLLSFLGLPHLRSFSNLQYRRIESLIGFHIRRIADESMQQQLDLEVTLTQENKNEHKQSWKTCDNPIGLTVGYDMGWSKRSSGHKYDSMSGHAFLVGSRSKKH